MPLIRYPDYMSSPRPNEHAILHHSHKLMDQGLPSEIEKKIVFRLVGVELLNSLQRVCK